MTFLTHVSRNIARNKGRTIGLIFVVGFTLGMFLVLGQVTGSISTASGEVVASVPNIITVQSVNESIGGGTFHLCIGQCAGTGLNSSVDGMISETPNVASVQRVITQPLNPLASASGGGFACGSASDPGVVAEDTNSQLKLVLGSLSGAGAVTVTSGRTLITSDENGTSALVSQQYATANDLSVGSPLGVNGHEFSIVGIFSQSCYTVILPYPAGVSALGATGASILYVTVNQYQNVNDVLSSLQGRLGSSFNVQVLANADRASLQSAISSIEFGSQFGEYAALASGAAVMVVVTYLVTSRRTREIGLLKALGYSGGRILGQTLLESLIIALLGLPLALLLSVYAGPLIAQSVLGGVGSLNPLGAPPPGSGDVTGSSGGANPFLQNVHFALTPEVLVLGAVITVSFGLLGALYPALRALLLRPTDALRHE